MPTNRNKPCRKGHSRLDAYEYGIASHKWLVCRSCAREHYANNKAKIAKRNAAYYKLLRERHER